MVIKSDCETQEREVLSYKGTEEKKKNEKHTHIKSFVFVF